MSMAYSSTFKKDTQDIKGTENDNELFKYAKTYITRRFKLTYESIASNMSPVVKFLVTSPKLDVSKL